MAGWACVLTSGKQLATLSTTHCLGNHRGAGPPLSLLFLFFCLRRQTKATNQEVAGSSPAGRAKSITYSDVFSCQNPL